MSDPTRHTIKRDDARTIAWDLDPVPTSSSVKVIIGNVGQTPIVARTVTRSGARVSITLTALETAIDGKYRAEFKADGITWPADGYVEVVILPDLD